MKSPRKNKLLYKIQQQKAIYQDSERTAKSQSTKALLSTHKGVHNCSCHTEIAQILHLSMNSGLELQNI